MSKKFTITTDGGTTIEITSGQEVVLSVDDIDYTISIKE